jgi:flagellar biosynthesis protein
MPRAKKTKQAFAIRPPKRPGEKPTVHAAGSGLMAEKIIELARKNGIPVNEDPAMVEALSHLSLEQEIPPELCPVVGEILNFAYRVNDAMLEADERRRAKADPETVRLPPKRY